MRAVINATRPQSETEEGTRGRILWFQPLYGGVRCFLLSKEYLFLLGTSGSLRISLCRVGVFARSIGCSNTGKHYGRRRMSLSCEVIAKKILGEPHHLSAGEAYYNCPNHEDRHPSLKINFSKDKFLCGPCSAGGGPWTLAAFLARVGANEKKAVAAWLRDHGFNEQEKKVREPKPDRTAYRQVAMFYYTPVLRNVRFETVPEGDQKPDKTFQWQHNENGKWVPGGGGMPKPLYTNKLFREAKPLEIAVGFEGEAKCDLAGTLGFMAFSFKYLSKEECVKLSGVDVILWPDADQPGIKQAKVAADLLFQSKRPRSIKICSPPLELPVGGDIVDAVKMLNWEKLEICKLLSEAAKYPPDPKPIGIRLSRIVPQQAAWRWQNRIPSGTITLLDGDPKTGKSLLALEIAARISRGEELPDNGCPHPPSNVVILSAEDSLEVTIRPRLNVAHADLDKIVTLPYSSDKPGEECFTRIPRDLKLLEKLIEQEHAVLVIVDVLAAYIPAEISMHRDQDVRGALAPMSAIANRTGASFLLLRHLTKNVGASPIYRGGGSIGITGASRSSLLLARDPANPDLRTLAVIASNLGPVPQSVSLRINAVGGIPRIDWQGFNQESAESLLSSVTTPTTIKEKEGQSALVEAVEWLKECLSNGPMSSDEVHNQARENFITTASLRRARASMNIRIFRSGGLAGKGNWNWELH